MCIRDRYNGEIRGFCNYYAIANNRSCLLYTSDILSAGEIMLYPSAHTVIVSGNEVELTHKEYELLHLFLQNKNQVFSREQLLNRIWGFDFEGNTRTVDSHIKTLRQKLGTEGRHIVTLIRSGYKFEVKPWAIHLSLLRKNTLLSQELYGLLLQFCILLCFS